MQKDIFLKEEGDQWYNRNTRALEGKNLDADHVVGMFEKFDLQSKKVLEIGCSDGYRLDHLQKKYAAEAYGIDPSAEAINKGNEKYKAVRLSQGTAEDLRFEDNMFDVVIYGFCLYLCDREDLFRIASEGNRVLKDSGKIIILDFYPPFAYLNKYSHKENVNTFKMQYESMFLWNPDYTRIYIEVLNHSGGNDINNPDDRVAISVLQKNSLSNYPPSPFNK